MLKRRNPLEREPMRLDYEQLPEKHRPVEEVPPAHQQTLWPHYANIVLGAWLVAAAFTYGQSDVGSGVARIDAERGLSSPELRLATLFWSDLVSGMLIIGLAGCSLSARNAWAPWAVCGIGLWLLFAPLALWAPTAGIYTHDTLIGTLVFAFAVIIPKISDASAADPDAPPGWNYNPSAWIQRAPVIAFAFGGFFIARYLAAYQLGHLATVWDPFFPDGTRRVLDSDISLAFPISDAGLGAISYLLEALTGFLGGTRRWRTMPWLVILFGILVVPLGVVSIVLIILQPLAVGAWCALCLATALLMLVMISPALDEVIATCQFLLQSRRAGRPFWSTFWKGGEVAASAESLPLRHGSTWQELLSAAGLSSVPWNLLASAALGVWLMFAPAALQTNGAAANSDHVTGALVVTVAVIAIGEIARAARFLNLVFAVWLLAGPWLLSGGTAAAMGNDMAVGAALLLLSLPRGKVTERFGGWDRYVV
jgi:uncharacterized membrane protein